ncbi:MAG: PilZ domain-containing protein [Fimbriimonadales bacterium]
MTESRLTPGQDCRLTLVALDSIREVTGQVIRAEIEGAVILIEAPVVNARPGTTIMLGTHESADVAFSTVSACTTVRRKVAVKLATIKWQKELPDRCTRHPVQYRCIVTISECDSRGNNERRTVGEMVNISATGGLLRSRSLLTVGTNVHIQIFVESKQPVLALAKVVRLSGDVERTDSGVVGVKFLRFLSGLEQLEGVFGEESKFAPCDAQPESEPEPNDELPAA